MSRLTVTPLLYTLAAMVILSGVLGFNLKLAKAATATAQATATSAVTERDAWKVKTVDALAANEAYASIIDKQARINEEQRAHAEAAAKLAAKQVDKAQAEADRAKTERDTFKRRFNAKPKNCEAALNAMQAACPTLGDY